jgi:hypothetical protein
MVESTAKVKSENCNGILAFVLLSLLCQQKKIISGRDKDKRFWLNRNKRFFDAKNAKFLTIFF